LPLFLPCFLPFVDAPPDDAFSDTAERGAKDKDDDDAEPAAMSTSAAKRLEDGSAAVLLKPGAGALERLLSTILVSNARSESNPNPMYAETRVEAVADASGPGAKKIHRPFHCRNPFAGEFDSTTTR
jgi:hypothetical protein